MSVPTVFSSILLMGALRRCVLLHSPSDLKVTWVNVQQNLIREHAFRITDIYIYIYI